MTALQLLLRLCAGASVNKLIYSGTFDPFTNGHLDIAARASKLCAELIILVLSNQEKTALFTYEERLDLIKNQSLN